MPPPFRSVSSTGWPVRNERDCGRKLIELLTVNVICCAPAAEAGAGTATLAPSPLVTAVVPQADVRVTPAVRMSAASCLRMVRISFVVDVLYIPERAATARV